jgi:hypothetical protein
VKKPLVAAERIPFRFAEMIFGIVAQGIKIQALTTEEAL